MMLGSKFMRPAGAGRFQLRQLITQVPPKRGHVRFFQTHDTGPRMEFGQSNKVVQRFHAKDNIPPQKYQLIYRCTFPNYVLMCQAGNFCVLIAAGISILITAWNETDFDASAEGKSPLFLGQASQTQNETTSIPSSPSESSDAARDKKGFWRNLWLVRKWREGNEDMERKRRLQLKEDELPMLQFEDLRDEAGPGTVAVLAIAMIGIMFTFMKFQQTLPMRIYTSKSGHSIGVFLGHFVPGRTTQKQFVAGTLTRAPTSKFLPSTSVFQTPTGMKMILFEKMFRYPADFNHLLGIQQNFKHKDDESPNS